MHAGGAATAGAATAGAATAGADSAGADTAGADTAAAGGDRSRRGIKTGSRPSGLLSARGRARRGGAEARAGDRYAGVQPRALEREPDEARAGVLDSGHR